MHSSETILERQAKEHALSEFLREATLLIQEGFGSNVTRPVLLKQIDMLWSTKHSFRTLKPGEVFQQLQKVKTKLDSAAAVPENEVVTVFKSIANALITTRFSTEQRKEDYVDIVKVLFRIKEGLVKHKKPLGKLEFFVGSAEQLNNHPALKQVLDNLSSVIQFQKLPGKGKGFTKPTVIPSVYLYRTKNHNGSATSSTKSFYLIGEDILYQKAQTSFIND